MGIDQSLILIWISVIYSFSFSEQWIKEDNFFSLNPKYLWKTCFAPADYVWDLISVILKYLYIATASTVLSIPLTWSPIQVLTVTLPLFYWWQGCWLRRHPVRVVVDDATRQGYRGHRRLKASHGLSRNNRTKKLLKIFSAAFTIFIKSYSSHQISF